MGRRFSQADCAIRLAAVGDLFLGDHFFTIGHGVRARARSAGMPAVLGDLPTLCAGCDVVFGNLECALADVSCHSAAHRVESFRGDPSFARGLSEAGFTVLNVANNHVLNHGAEAFEQTLAALRSAGIGAVGEEGPAGAGDVIPLVTLLRGLRVGWVGFSSVPDATRCMSGGYAVFSPPGSLQALERARAAVDVLVVSHHGGQEAAPAPSADRVRQLRDFVDAGADLVLGHHGHVYHGYEIYRDRLIVHDLGDCVFDLFWREEFCHSAVVRAELGSNGACIGVEERPFRFSRDYRVHAISALEFQHVLTHVQRQRSRARSGHLSLQLQKLAFWLTHLPAGNRAAKLGFLRWKLAGLLLPRERP